jgi:hypothetical protein
METEYFSRKHNRNISRYIYSRKRIRILFASFSLFTYVCRRLKSHSPPGYLPPSGSLASIVGPGRNRMGSKVARWIAGQRASFEWILMGGVNSGSSYHYSSARFARARRLARSVPTSVTVIRSRSWINLRSMSLSSVAL